MILHRDTSKPAASNPSNIPMNPLLKRSFACVVLPALFTSNLSSCAGVLENTGLSTATGAALGAGLGALVDGNNRGRGALIGGALGGATGFMLAKHYQATQAQKRYAEQQAYAASRKASTKKQMTANRTRYVAVPVKPSGDQQAKSSAKNLVMVYDTDTGELASDQAYVPSKSSYSAGEVVNFGGKKSVVATGFSGI